LPKLDRHIAHAAALSYLIEALYESSLTADELCKLTGLGDTTVRKIIRCLRRRGVLRVDVWRNDSMGRATIAAFRLGRGPDAVRRCAKTATERSADRRARDQRRLMEPA
jgi:predicted ArsR family transcriptional regulator